MENIRRKEKWMGEIGGGEEAWETVDSEKQTEGFGGDGSGGLGDPGDGY